MESRHYSRRDALQERGYLYTCAQDGKTTLAGRGAPVSPTSMKFPESSSRHTKVFSCSSRYACRFLETVVRTVLDWEGVLVCATGVEVLRALKCSRCYSRGLWNDPTPISPHVIEAHCPVVVHTDDTELETSLDHRNYLGNGGDTR